MKECTECLISKDASILEALQTIDRGKMQIALVVAPDKKLLGTVTDGDIRRGILKGVSLQSPVSSVMNTSPARLKNPPEKHETFQHYQNLGIRHLPIVDADGRVLGIEILDELLKPEARENFVVLMAGGRGKRLQHLTENCPKPLLKVGTRPLMETILLGLIDHGFSNFFISVNYKAEMFYEYFGDGSKWGVRIRYLQELEQLGTAGPLSLLPENPQHPVLVMNADLLTKINYAALLDFHQQRQADATMCVREFDFQVPYGVVKFDEETIQTISEKPVQRFFVNAGIYILNPEVISQVEKGQALDMPSLFQEVLNRKGKAVAFPISEYWMDIGRLDDFERANGEFLDVFPNPRESD